MNSTCANCGAERPAAVQAACPACGITPASQPVPSMVGADPYGTGDPFGGNPFRPAGSAPTAPVGVTQAEPPAPGGRQGMSTTAKVLIGVGVGFVVFVVLAVIAVAVLLRGAAESFEADGGAPLFGGTTVTNLVVGDCFDIAASNTRVSCNDTHTHEVFGMVPWTSGSNYPSEMDVFSEVYCDDLFASYVGIDYYDSAYFYETARPVQADWEAGDRDIRCVLYEPGSTLDESAQGAAR